MTEYEDWIISESDAWLKHIRRINHELVAADDTLEVIRRLQEPGGIDYSQPHVNGSPKGDVMADIIAATDELMGRWRDRRLELIGEQEDARAVILRMPTPRYRVALLLYYVNGRTWDEASDLMGYEPNTVKKWMPMAKMELHRFLPDGWRTDVPKSIN